MGVPLVVHAKNGKVCATLVGQEFCLDWRPGGSKKSLAAEVGKLAAMKFVGWKAAAVQVVVSAAVDAFLKRWAASRRERKIQEARDVARSLRQSKGQRYGWER